MTPGIVVVQHSCSMKDLILIHSPRYPVDVVACQIVNLFLSLIIFCVQKLPSQTQNESLLDLIYLLTGLPGRGMCYVKTSALALLTGCLAVTAQMPHSVRFRFMLSRSICSSITCMHPPGHGMVHSCSVLDRINTYQPKTVISMKSITAFAQRVHTQVLFGMPRPGEKC